MARHIGQQRGNVAQNCSDSAGRGHAGARSGVRAEQHIYILVVGGTASGKTTLTNALLAELAELTPADRLVLIEDTTELQCAVTNAIPSGETSTSTLRGSLWPVKSVDGNSPDGQGRSAQSLSRRSPGGTLNSTLTP